MNSYNKVALSINKMVTTSDNSELRLPTRLTELLGVEHPVMLAGMGGISYSRLCAAVSEAGGFGCLGGAQMASEKLLVEIGAVRDATAKPFGVNLLTAVPEQIERNIEILIASGVKLFVAGLGVPRDAVDRLHAANILVATVCGSRRHALRAVDAGCDLVIAQGTEGGGHTGTVATMALVPAIIDAVGPNVPVVAAGGIADGRGLAAALALGAEGVWVGTRFAATPEARRLDGFHDALVKHSESDTVITRSYSGKTMRVIANQWTAHYEAHPEDLKPFPEQMRHAVASGATHLGASESTQVDRSIEGYLSGQSVGLIHSVRPAGDIVRSMVAEAAGILQRVARNIR